MKKKKVNGPKDIGPLKSVIPIDIIRAFEFQKEHTGWTFYNEREFMENLLQTRFNFLITLYALFINAVFLSENSKMIILATGFFIITILGFANFRVYKKLIILLKILHKLGNNHVFSVVEKEMRLHKTRLFPVNQFIGVIIPLLLSLSLCVGIILLHLGVFKFD